MPTLFDTRVWRLQLTPDERLRVLQPTGTVGGFADHLRLLQQRLQQDDVAFDHEALQAIHRKACMNDGHGGYQAVFKILRSAAWRAGWVQDE